MADFSLRDLWWLKPAEPDNPLPALQLGAQIVQNKARLDIERAQTTNDIARTSLMREEILAKQQIQTSILAGNAAMAKAIASINDFSDPVQMKRVWEVGELYPMEVGSKAWQGAEYMHRHAVAAKGLRERAEARTELDLLKEERQRLLANSEIDLEDARIREIDQDIAFAERQQTVREGNLELRREEIQQQGQKLSLRNQRMYDSQSRALEREEVAALKNVTNPTEARRLRINFGLRRNQLIERFYGPAEAAPTPVQREGLRTEPLAPPPVTPANPAGKVRVIAPDGTPGFIPASQLEEALKAGYKQP